MSSWQEYKAKNKISSNTSSSWQEYKKKMEQKKQNSITHKINSVNNKINSFITSDKTKNVLQTINSAYVKKKQEEQQRLELAQQEEKIKTTKNLETALQNAKTPQQKQALENYKNDEKNIMIDTTTPVKDIVNSRNLEIAHNKNGFFKASSAFDDGYQVGDISKTILGTGADAMANVTKGIANIGEGIGDAITYGIAGVADLAGNDEYADKLRYNASHINVVEDMFKPITDVTDKNSILGNKSDEVAQGVGYVAGNTAIAVASGGAGSALGLSEKGVKVAQTVGSTATTFTNSLGSGMSEAYQNGATDDEAFAYGLISATGETLSEAMFGGLGKASEAFGLSKGAFDDVITVGLTKKIKNKMAKTLVQSGLKATGEGAEEVVSGLFSIAGKKLTYMSEEDLKKISDDENLMEQFWMGALTSAIVQVPGTISSIKNKTDYVTGRTDFEQKVYDNEVNERANLKIKEQTIEQAYNEQIKTQENLGVEITEDLKQQIMQKVEKAYESGTLQASKLSKKDILKIQDEVETDMQKGNIFFESIMKTLAEDDKSKKSETSESLKNAQTDIQQQTILNDSKTTQNENINEIKASKINAPIKELNFYETAKKYNIDTQNESVQSIARLTNERGIKTKFDADVFSDRSQSAIWKISRDNEGNVVREVIINPNADTKKSLENIAIHELTHDLEGTEQYEQLKDVILQYDKSKTGYQEARQSLEELYSKVYDKNSTEFQSLIDNEAVADILGSKLGDQNFVNNLTTKNKSLGQKIYAWVVDKLNKLNSKIGYRNEKLYWTDVKNKFEKAFRQEYQNTNNEISKFSIQTMQDGSKYVKVDTDQDIFAGIEKKDYNKIAKMYMQDYLEGRTNLSKDDTVSIGNKGISKYTNPKQNTNYMNEKMQLSTELRNVLQIAEKIEEGSPTKATSKFPNWEYYKIKFEINGKKFEGLVNIGVDRNGDKHFYEINKIHITSNSHVSASKFSNTDSINNSITPLNKDVNNTTKYSMQESENNSGALWQDRLDTLYKNENKGSTIRETKETIQKYLDDRKVSYEVDENGNITNIEDSSEIDNFYNRKSDNDSETQNETHIQQTYAEKYNMYKKNIIKADTAVINNLIAYKNESIRSIEAKIKAKEDLLASKKNKDSKLANTIKSQIENLKAQKTKVENLYAEKIDKATARLSKEEINFQVRNEIKKQSRETIQAEIEPLIQDLTKYKDKKMGLLFNRETAQRNIDDIVKDKELAKAIKETIFDPVQVHQAEKIREINSLYEKINSLELDKKKKYYYIPENEIVGVKVDEATLAQLIIEKKLNDTDLRNYGINDDGIKKIHKTADTFTEILEYLYNGMNEEVIKYGYSPIGKLKDYFPHFFENKMDTTLGKFLGYLGIDISDQSLPTKIAGKTDTFKPGKTWNGNLLKRKGSKTDYNALQAMQNYIQVAEDIIYTTQDIQKVRTYSYVIRYKFSDAGLKAEIDKVLNNNQLTQDAKDAYIKGIFEGKKNGLPNFVTWLDDYANTLAGKKAFSDRGIERSIGRNIYSSMSKIESRIAANTIGGNLSVSLTNFAPIFQAAGSTKLNYLITGMLQTASNDVKGLTGKGKDISFVDNSNFLTNRFGVDSITQETIIQKVSDVASIPMNAIDEFTSESIVRAKYLENLHKGMNEQKALDLADKYAAKLMADRSKGALPLIFNAKNPLAKLVTMFQVEPNNMLSNYLKDMPRNANGKTQLIYQTTKLMVASWAFNTLAMAARGGSDVLPDPIHWVSDLIKAFTGDDDEREEARTDLAESIIGSLPFVSNIAGLFGMEDIGRIPISNAFPSISNLAKLTDNEADKQYKLEALATEISKPLLYLGLPVGGAQIKKTAEGIYTVANGGSYKTNKKGEKELRFPVENPNAGTYIKAGLFGKYSLGDAKAYSDRGYKALSAKETKMYEESNIPYKELLEYLDEGLTKTEDKIEYVSSKNLNTNQKWGIYTNDIFSKTEREDGGSQLSDAQYITSNGVSKKEFIEIYNKAKKNNISIPTEDEYKEMKENGISLNNYIDYKITVKKQTNEKRESGELTETQDLKNKDKIQILLDSDYSDDEIQAIYAEYIKNTNDKEYDVISKSNIKIKEYLKYKQQDFSSDIVDDGTTEGKTVSGSAKVKTYSFVNQMNISYEQRLLILGMQYKLTTDERTKLYNYVKSLDYTQDEMQKVFESLKGFTVYKNGRVTW